MSRRIRVNGHILPSELQTLIEYGLWENRRFDLAPDLLIAEIGDFLDFHEVWVMKSVTDILSGSNSSAYLGIPDSRQPPGDIDPRRAVLIADFGPGSDPTIALDYRGKEYEPSVLLLHWDESARTNNRWVEIAPTFRRFAELLGLETGS